MARIKCMLHIQSYYIEYIKIKKTGCFWKRQCHQWEFVQIMLANFNFIFSVQSTLNTSLTHVTLPLSNHYRTSFYVEHAINLKEEL